MLTFKTRSQAPISYLQSDAKRLLHIMGKDADAPQGIITPEQLGTALAAIEAAIAREEAMQQAEAGGGAEDPQQEQAQEAGDAGFAPVALRRRALPLMRLLKQAEAAGDPVVWEV